jgi:phosphohistidine phosphatase
MKTLYLLRHGHAETKAVQPDSSRNLDKEGRDEVQGTADKMLKGGINPELIISSHAIRAFQTAEIVAKTLGYNIKNIAIEKGIYYTDTETLIEVIERQEDKYQSILIAGHNPTITELAREISKAFNEQLPTGALAAFELHTNSWDNFMKNERKYLFCFYPQEP